MKFEKTKVESGGILALDLATKTGWAYGKPDKRGPTAFGSLKFKGERPAIYRELRRWLSDWIRAQPGLIVFESAAPPIWMLGRTRFATTKLLIGMCEHVEELCYERIELCDAMTSQVRAHFLGTNRIKRPEAKRLTIARCEKLGWHVANDNEADACALWHYQASLLSPEIAAGSVLMFDDRWV